MVAAPARVAIRMVAVSEAITVYVLDMFTVQMPNSNSTMREDGHSAIYIHRMSSSFILPSRRDFASMLIMIKTCEVGVTTNRRRRRMMQIRESVHSAPFTQARGSALRRQ
jgi:hypothetical protein